MEKPIRVLVITPQYAPDYGPSAPIFTALCEDLKAMGDDVQVITAFPNHSGSEKENKNPKKMIQKDSLNGINIFRTFILQVPKNSLVKRLIYHASYNIFSTLATFQIKKPDVILADAPTLWSGLPLLIKAILPGVPYVYIVHDIYPDVLLKTGMIHNKRVIHLIERIENFFYNRAGTISVLSTGFQKNLAKKKVNLDKLVVIPVCVDTDFFQPFSHNNYLRNQWNLQGKFIVLYAGNIGFTQGLDIVLNTAILLYDYPEIQFVIVGEGSTKDKLVRSAVKNNLDNVHFYPFQSREEVPYIYAMSDICLVTLDKDIDVESVPSKTYTIMAAGRPIIATVNRETEIWNLLEQSQAGICCPPGEAQDMAKAILTFYQDTNLCQEMGKKGRDFVVKYYSRTVASQMYQNVIERIVKRKK